MKINTLVVDNNPVLLKAVSTILEQEGCRVWTAENGLEAIESAKKHLPDIIFTDLVMPQVSGERLCKVIRSTAELKNIFIVILSAIVHEERERILSEIDYDVCIAKGTLKDLRAHLKEALIQFKDREEKTTEIIGTSDVVGNNNNGFTNIAKEILHEHHHLKIILENLSEGVVELSPDGKIVSINKAASQIFEKKIEEVIGSYITDMSWDSHFIKIKQWVEKELVGNGGKVLRVYEEDPLVCNKKILTAYFLPIRKDNSYFSVCIFRDITRQYIAEKKKEDLDNAIRLVKKMDAMSCMAGGVAHDFNNLLTVICGNLDMIDLHDEKINRHEIESLVNNARDTAHVTVELVRKISCFSPFGIIQREDVSVKDFLSTLVEECNKKNKTTLCKILPYKGDYCINIDPTQIRTAVENVFQNSIESGQDVTIEVQIEDEKINQSSIRSGQYVSAGNYVKITISDNGSGIEKENMLEIFDPYFSTKNRGALKGVGLGLTIVYSTLRNHGGYVVVESKKGIGTEIVFYLPIFKTNEQLMVDGIGGKPHLLLVEGDDQLRIISKIMVEYLGYTVFEASDPEEALQVFTENIDDISIAIINLVGKGKQDGVDICRSLQKMKPEVKMIVSSGSLLDPVMRNCREYGFCNTLQKPFTMDDLRSVLSFI